ncbi:MAG: cytochrome b N-terminal domain-containing protein [Candidatus Korarchaeum sp.]|nr:cytochrome b N-terminal domain-containing protein [Candidatus Korarchaeum sp.]
MSCEERSCISRFVDWFIDRLGMKSLKELKVYRHTLHPLYSLGGLTTLMLVILGITGILLLMFYVPVFGESNLAYDSIVRIMDKVAYGSVIRSLHNYAANLMILLSMIHFLRVYFMGAYKKPHELTYVIGILTGLLAILCGVTGYSLRMDHIAAEAIRIGNTLVSNMPGGKWIAPLIYGIGTFDEIIGRYFAYHILLAGLIALLALIHFLMVHMHHASPPYDGSDPEPAVPFFPNHLLTEISAISVVIGALIILSAAFPAELGQKFLPTEILPVGQPEWYLMAIYAGIKTGVDPFLAFAVVPGILLLVLVLMPWIDPAYSRHPRNRRIATLYGSILLGEFIVFTIYGILTPGQEIPLIYAIAIGLATAIAIGLPVAKCTSKPVPPKKAPRVRRVRHRPQILSQAKYILLLILIVQVASLALGVNSHIQELYSLAAIYFGISIMAFGWIIFIAKVITLDIPYITRQAEVKV